MIRPTNDRLLVEVLPTEQERSSLIARPSLEDHDREPQRMVRAKVLASGPGRFMAPTGDGNSSKRIFIENERKPGEVVYFQACMADAIVGLDPYMHRPARECEPGDQVLVEERQVMAVEVDDG